MIINPYTFAAAGGGGDYVDIEPGGGETVTTSGDYKYVKFDASSSFDITDAGGTGSSTFQYLLVAGGGGGGSYESPVSSGGGGGGGGGEYEYAASYTAVVQS